MYTTKAFSSVSALCKAAQDITEGCHDAMYMIIQKCSSGKHIYWILSTNLKYL